MRMVKGLQLTHWIYEKQKYRTTTATGACRQKKRTTEWNAPSRAKPVPLRTHRSDRAQRGLSLKPAAYSLQLGVIFDVLHDIADSHQLRGFFVRNFDAKLLFKRHG
jgi:hypothetical protein